MGKLLLIVINSTIIINFTRIFSFTIIYDITSQTLELVIYWASLPSIKVSCDYKMPNVYLEYLLKRITGFKFNVLCIFLTYKLIKIKVSNITKIILIIIKSIFYAYTVILKQNIKDVTT